MKKESNISFSREELIDDFGIIFVEGAVYKDSEGDLWECTNSGNFFASDCYQLDHTYKRMHAWFTPKYESDFKHFVGFRDALEKEQVLVA